MTHYLLPLALSLNRFHFLIDVNLVLLDSIEQLHNASEIELGIQKYTQHRAGDSTCLVAIFWRLRS